MLDLTVSACLYSTTPAYSTERPACDYRPLSECREWAAWWAMRPDLAMVVLCTGDNERVTLQPRSEK